MPLATLTSGFLTVNSDSIYSPINDAIYSLTTGSVIWTETFPYPQTGFDYDETSTLSGSYVVFTSGTKVLVDLP